MVALPNATVGQKAVVGQGLPNFHIGSLDANNLYLSLKVEEVTKILDQVIDEAPVKFNNIEYKEVAKYLRIKLIQQEVDDLKIDKFLPKCYTRRGKLTPRYLEKDRIYVKLSGANPVDDYNIEDESPNEKRCKDEPAPYRYASTPTVPNYPPSMKF